MITSLRAIDSFELGQHQELFRSNAIFLSASIPYLKKREEFDTDEKWVAHQRHVRTAVPDRIRDAVIHVARALARHKFSLIFGAHPSISPLILDVVRETEPDSDVRVLIFQSHFFDGKIPTTTLELADWTYGQLLKTRAIPGANDREARENSLAWMREVMLRSPNLCGGIFIGGMQGILDEAELFVRLCPGKPFFALGSPGGAAVDLLDRRCGTGRSADERLLRSGRSYPLIAKRILEDLGIR